MSEGNDTVVWILGHDLVGPIQHFVARVVLKRDNHKFHPSGLEVIPGIVMAIRIEGAAKLASFCKFLTGEVGVEMSGAVDTDIAAILIVRLLVAHVMVSQAHAIRHCPV